MTITTPLPEVTESRKLATIETIESIREIEGADAIVCARIRGWDVVVKRDEFQPGDDCLYIEVDALVPTEDPRFAFLAPRGLRTDQDGNTGHVLKTARLRGQYSQGLALPLAEFPEVVGADDVTAVLGIVEWDPPLPAELNGEARGTFPSWIRKTDEERIQNKSEFLDRPGRWGATEKVDGSSMTVWVRDGVDGIASRNYDLERTPGSAMWLTADDLGLHDLLRSLGDHAAVQGELFGPGIQGNPLNQKQVSFLAFTLFVDGQEIPRGAWPQAVLDVAVPVYDFVKPTTIDEALAQVEMLKSLVAPGRGAEGVVWRDLDSTTMDVRGQNARASTKVLSRKYLLKHDR
ncbi:RNA ligase (ATP) [Frigoribacterium sp. SL97]|uniref:RNA ligase (ATP) n=1 Tax=Frigoribacterium sp. SL97 TaxID=2994664 RepID=UPI002271981E|nr:RNA ligase (ATP) [Frigoribacterium sp. SL97]WAC50547.1 RNA ligase (ATP) [Frigoribacterium sp. SL97]